MVETPFEREDVIRVLTENEYTHLFFTKVDGTQRSMLATLNPDQLERLARDPEHGFTVGSYISEEDLGYDENQVRVYDIEKRGWRSFLLTNLITIEGHNQ